MKVLAAINVIAHLDTLASTVKNVGNFEIITVDYLLSIRINCISQVAYILQFFVMGHYDPWFRFSNTIGIGLSLNAYFTLFQQSNSVIP